MHSLVLVEVPNPTISGNTENSIKQRLKPYYQLSDDLEDLEKEDILLELIGKDHLEHSHTLDLKLFQKKPIKALTEAFNRAHGIDPIFSPRGVAIFSAKKYLRFEPTEHSDVSDVLESLGKIGDNKSLTFTIDRSKWTEVAVMDHAQLKALNYGNIDYIIFVNDEGEPAIGRQICHRGKWDWYELGGRFSNRFLNNVDEFTNYIDPCILRVGDHHYNQKADIDLRTCLNDLIESGSLRSEVLSDFKDSISSTIPEEILEAWIAKHPDQPTVLADIVDSAFYLSKRLETTDSKILNEIGNIQWTMPRAMVTKEHGWREYGSLESRKGGESLIDFYRRIYKQFLKDLKEVPINSKLAVVDFHY